MPNREQHNCQVLTTREEFRDDYAQRRDPIRDLTNNLKLMRREVVENLRLREPGFAVNAEVGLSPLLMGFSVKEVAISWINRAADMGVSSFYLTKVGYGYWRVLARLASQTRLGFCALPRTARELPHLETHVAQN